MKKQTFMLLPILVLLMVIPSTNFVHAVTYEATTMDGELVNLEKYQGKAVMLNGWATWCKDCLKEMPALEALHKEFEEQGLVVIGTSTDLKGFDDKVSAFADRLGVTYTILRDPDDRFSRTFKAVGLPHTVLFDRQGEVVYEWRGAFEPMSEDTKHKVNIALGNIKNDLIEEDQIAAIGFALAFSAGLLSFLSPCVLPLIPAYASFLTGTSVKEMENVNAQGQNQVHYRYNALKRGLLFVLGFSVIFVAIGASTAFVGSFFTDASEWIARIGGIIVIIFGLHILGILKIPILSRQLKFDSSKQTVRNAGPLVVGITFGAGWTPCIGPILAGILTIAAVSSSATMGAALLGVYSLGLAIPFIISAVAIEKFVKIIRRLRKWMNMIEKISGALLIIVGILLLSGSLVFLSSMFGETLTLNISDM
ncbi:hypothetical protein C6988_03770 [Nitrosopumilus sp. b1]|uniref:redoxin domain-containing protein n=1 Tax=Nitrosopumilus sp. b1 TaxID=2109907 RepID=UPI0015F46056|nr:cytochrome c biogenesis protein CcdA [Nitrosopumilus sp. b1]KAF6243372.1 hypothetical protein C6988_03770 [Nitrosopumilus sp. b1]